MSFLRRLSNLFRQRPTENSVYMKEQRAQTFTQGTVHVQAERKAKDAWEKLEARYVEARDGNR